MLGLSFHLKITLRKTSLGRWVPSQAFMKCLENYYEVAVRLMEWIKLFLHLEKKMLGQKKKGIRLNKIKHVVF